jgi:hypothetical protein
MLRNAFIELATNYGPIAQFWFDHGNELFVDLVDKHQPDALVLGRDFISDGAPALAPSRASCWRVRTASGRQRTRWVRRTPPRIPTWPTGAIPRSLPRGDSCIPVRRPINGAVEVVFASSKEGSGASVDYVVIKKTSRMGSASPAGR